MSFNKTLVLVFATSLGLLIVGEFLNFKYGMDVDIETTENRTLLLTITNKFAIGIIVKTNKFTVAQF